MGLIAAIRPEHLEDIDLVRGGPCLFVIVPGHPGRTARLGFGAARSRIRGSCIWRI